MKNPLSHLEAIIKVFAKLCMEIEIPLPWRIRSEEFFGFVPAIYNTCYYT